MEHYGLQGNPPGLGREASMLALTTLSPTALSWVLGQQEALLRWGIESPDTCFSLYGFPMAILIPNTLVSCLQQRSADLPEKELRPQLQTLRRYSRH